MTESSTAKLRGAAVVLASSPDPIEYLRIVEQTPSRFVVEQPARPGAVSWLATLVAVGLLVLAFQLFRRHRRWLAVLAIVAAPAVEIVGLWDGGSANVTRLSLDLNARTFQEQHRYGSTVLWTNTISASDLKSVSLERIGSKTDLYLVHYPRGGVNVPLTQVEDQDSAVLQQTFALAEGMLQKQRRVEAGLPDPPAPAH